VDQIPQDPQVPRPSSERVATAALSGAHAGEIGVPGPPLISADVAAEAILNLFLANADRGHDAANDQLVAELVRRIHAQQASRASGC
jgi:hypothetical protein